jgi:hypothetical protein
VHEAVLNQEILETLRNELNESKVSNNTQAAIITNLNNFEKQLITTKNKLDKLQVKMFFNHKTT